jgi:hypothetical protein
MKTRSALITAALITAAAPVWGQAVGTAVGPVNSGVQSVSPIPDFSGIWSHPFFPGFEPPVSGPGSVVNKSRRRQVFGDNGRPLPATSNVLVGNGLS